PSAARAEGGIQRPAPASLDVCLRRSRGARPSAVEAVPLLVEARPLLRLLLREDAERAEGVDAPGDEAREDGPPPRVVPPQWPAPGAGAGASAAPTWWRGAA